jgi:ribonuclease HI
MAKTKFYAIKHGVDPQTNLTVGALILDTTWADAERYIKGVKGAEFKSFTKREDAEAYIQGDSSSLAVNLEMQPDVFYCFVDGSFNQEIPNYSFGLCAIMNEKVVHINNGQGSNPSAIAMQQVGGELLGALMSLVYAKSRDIKKVVILHDYLGVANHATGTWKRDSDYSKVYHNWMQNFFKSNPEMNISFLKVDAHTGNDFNEIADGLAKMALGITPNPIFYRMVEKHNVKLSEDLFFAV